MKCRKSPSENTTDKLQRRNRELFVLHQIAEALNRKMNLDEALQTALAQVAELFGLNTGWIFLYDSDSRQPYLAAAQNLPPALAKDACLLMEGTCYCLSSHASGGLANKERPNVITCSRLKELMDGTDGLRYHASIPLEAQNKPLGLLNVASAESNWWRSSNESLHLLHTVGDLLSIAIERAYLFAQSTQLGVIEERNRLAREIHDTLAQSLTGIALRLETIDAMLEAGADPVAVRGEVQRGLQLTQSTLDEARRSVMDLRAAPLAGRNLVEALLLLAQEHQQQSQAPRVTFNVVGGNRPLPVRLEMGLYRIAQEVMNNTAQHAGATQIDIELTIVPEQVRLIIEDDGRGFEPTDVPTGHFGLIGLNERVKLLGGRLTLESAPGAGVRVEVTVSLQNQEQDG